MAKHFGTVRNRAGAVVPGTSVYVYDSSGGLASLTNDLGVDISNPLTSRGDGGYEFNTDDGIYSIKIDGDTSYSVAIGAGVGAEITDTYEETGHSHQTVAADLNVGADVGSVGTNPKFIAAFMGNIIGDLLSKAGAYLSGVVGAFSITGARATDYPLGGVVGVVMDGVTDCDGPIVSVIDGSDPSAPTNVGAMFKGRMNNNHASSGANYGLDVYDPGNANYTGGPVPLKIIKAELRMSHEVCLLTGAGVPSTAGTGFAAKGSLYIDITNGKLYINGGSSGTPSWKLVTSA